MTVTYLQFPEGINVMFTDNDRKNHTFWHGAIQISGMVAYPDSNTQIIVKTMKISYPRWKNRYGS